MVRVRFAPSPTGSLHIGGARTALFNFVFAKHERGQFVLRIDDTDKERSLKKHEEEIYKALRWLGLSWDEGPDVGGPHGPYRQSERTEKYLNAAKELSNANKAYYDPGKALRLSYPATEVIIDDLVCGECKFSLQSLGTEPVLVRSDGSPTYHLASVVDDIEMKITHVIRGQDHLTNTAKHKLLFEALGATPPQFAHLPLILGKDGSKLLKRQSEDLVSVYEFQEQGYLPEALVSFLMLLGWSHPEAQELLSMQDAIQSFSLARVKQTAAIFETNKLNFMNGHFLRTLPVEHIAEELLKFTAEYQTAVVKKGKKYWLDAVAALRDGLHSLSEARALAQSLVAEEVPIEGAAIELFSNAENKAAFTSVVSAWIKLLEDVPLEADRDCYTTEVFSKLISRLKKSQNIDPKLLFKALRVAMLGELSGPELKVIGPFLSRNVLLLRASNSIRSL